MAQSSPTVNKNKRVVKSGAVVFDYKYFLGFGFLVLIILFLVSQNECLSPTQANVFHIVLAIGVAGLAAALPGFIEVNYKSVVAAGGALGVFIVVISLNPANSGVIDVCEPTNLTAHLETNRAVSNAFVNEEVGLYMGDQFISFEEVGSYGQVYFKNIHTKFLKDSVKLRFTNPKFSVVKQSKYFIASPNEAIIFTLEIAPDTTLVKGTVTANGQSLFNATIVFNNEFKAITDETGTYKLALPYKEGTNCEVRILHDDKEILRRYQLISSIIPVSFDL